MITGRVHSVESFGATDGPGIRMVVFLQGCMLRCKYCHNPDTWDVAGGEELEANTIIEKFERNRDFYSKGGITVSGGEPLLQLSFVIELFMLAHEHNIHTCLDTSGAPFVASRASEYEPLAGILNLVLLDFKHATDEGCRALTGKGNANTLAFAKWLQTHNVPTIVRHVIVPGITNDEKELRAVTQLAKQFKNVRALELLPYHTLGIKKYRELGRAYPLEGVPRLSKEKLTRAQAIVQSELKR